MNPRPIIIASTIAVLFVVAVYFSGRLVYEQGHIEDTSPPTVSKQSGQVDNTRTPTARPNNTPTTDTRNEQQTSVTKQPAPTMDTKADNNRVNTEIPETTAENKTEAVSPHGFGPYPKVPDDYPRDPYWISTLSNPKQELLERVLIKLWEQGVHAEGASYANGLIYPTIPGTVYIKWSDDGTHISRMKGHPDDDHENIKEQIEAGETPSGITILEYDETGIDPYQFLNLE